MTISGPVPMWATAGQARQPHAAQPVGVRGLHAEPSGATTATRSTTWAIWNEPNQPQFLRPQFARGNKAISPTIYRKLYQAGVRGLAKAGQGNDTILMGRDLAARDRPRRRRR